MLEIGAGVVSGIVSALGMGGGTILIVILSIFLGLDQHLAQGTNILFFVPTSITAIVMNIKNKNINWGVAKTICLFGAVGAVIGAIISINLSTVVLKKIYGVFLGMIAIYEIYGLVNKKLNGRNNKKENKIQ